MIISIPKGARSIPIYDGAADCHSYGVIIQSLDANGAIYVSGEQGLLDATVDANGNPGAGLLVQRSSAITNVPSQIVIAPCSNPLFARNTGAADSLLSVEKFKL